MGQAARETLAANLTRLMAATDRLRTIKKLSKASGVSTGTIDRIRRAQVSAGVDQLTALAKPFGLEAYQLLEENLEASSTEARQRAKEIQQMTPEQMNKLDQAIALATDRTLAQLLHLRERNLDSALGDLPEDDAATK
jgi:hypothetical protein